jgi:hypothetical protein
MFPSGEKYMYEGWIVERWETSVSDAKSLVLVSLLDQHGQVSIVVQDLRDPNRRRFRFTSQHYPAYRNILEEFRLELWTQLTTGI